LRLAISTRAEAYLVLTSADYRSLFPAAVAIMQKEVDRISAVPGPVACSAMTVCRRAGKTFAVDDFAIANRIKTGRMTAEEFLAKRQSLGIQFVVVDQRATIEPLLRRF